MSKKRVGAVGAIALLVGGYVLGIDEGQEPGSTDAKLMEARNFGATVGGHGVGLVQDARAIAGPALGDLGNAVGGAVTPGEQQLEGVDSSLITPPPGG